MANCCGYSRRPDQLASHQANELPRISAQHFFEWPPRLRIRHSSANRADLCLFQGLHRAASRSPHLRAYDGVDIDGGIHSILYHLQPGDVRVLDFGDHHHRIHRLFVRIFPGRSDVSHRHHAVRDPGGDEVAAVLLRVVLPGRDLSRPIERSRACASVGDPNGVAIASVGLREIYVATRPRPLPGRWRVTLLPIAKTNAERSTPNAERPIHLFRVGCWTLSVERWAFSSEIAPTHGPTSRVPRQSHFGCERI